MSAPLHNERRSFLFFLFLILVTAFVMGQGGLMTSALGVLGIVWGVFGFFRLIYLLQNNSQNTAHILNLPSRILFGMDAQALQRRDSVLARLTYGDVRFWFIGLAVFCLWALFCTLSPDNIPLVTQLHAKQNAVLGDGVLYYSNYYNITQSFTRYGIIAIIIFLSLSYSLSRTNIRWAYFTLVPLFFIGVVYVVFSLGWAGLPLLPVIDSFKGGGIGQSFIVDILSRPLMEQFGTGLFRRYIELGWVGAYGVYMLFIPAFYMLLRMMFNPVRSTLKPFLALIIMLCLGALDIFWVFGDFPLALLVLGLPLIALCWGASGFHARAPLEPLLGV